MSRVLKCPNPSCPFTFDPARVPAGVVVSCPRCMTPFTLAAPPPVAPAPTPPADLAFEPNPAPAVERVRGSGGPGGLQTFFLALFAACLLAGVGLAIYFRVFDKTPAKSRGGDANERRDLNVAFDPPPEPWERDEELRVRVGPPAFLAFRRAGPDAAMVFGAKDFRTHAPRPSDLLGPLNGILTRLFENIPTRHELVPGVTWMGQDATHFTFRGTARDGEGNVVGECHAASFKGVAYWAVCWAAEDEYASQTEAFAAARSGFRLLGERDGWAARKAAVVTHRGDKLDYAITDAEGIWKDADAKPETEDPKADKFLVARINHEGSDRAEEAELVVYILDDAADPLDAVRRYVEGNMNRDPDNRGTNTFTKLEGEPAGDPVQNPVPTPSPVLRLRSRNDRSASYSWLIVLSAAKVGGKVVGVHARCPWEDRAAFEAKFVQIAGSLREGR